MGFYFTYECLGIYARMFSQSASAIMNHKVNVKQLLTFKHKALLFNLCTVLSSDRSPAGVSVSRTPSSRASGLIRSPQATESISESIKVSISRGQERSASESSMPEDIVASARDKSHDSEKSRDSPIPEVEMKTHSQETSIPEDIPEEYVNDTFESFESTATPTHSTPLRKDSSIKKDTSPSRSRRSSNDGSKSEEEASMTGEKGTLVLFIFTPQTLFPFTQPPRKIPL